MRTVCGRKKNWNWNHEFECLWQEKCLHWPRWLGSMCWYKFRSTNRFHLTVTMPVVESKSDGDRNQYTSRDGLGISICFYHQTPKQLQDPNCPEMIVVGFCLLHEKLHIKCILSFGSMVLRHRSYTFDTIRKRATVMWNVKTCSSQFTVKSAMLLLTLSILGVNSQFMGWTGE